jgi:hypothetical protein
VPLPISASSIKTLNASFYTVIICLTETSSSNLIAATIFSSTAPCSGTLSSATAGSAVLLLFSLT